MASAVEVVAVVVVEVEFGLDVDEQQLISHDALALLVVEGSQQMLSVVVVAVDIGNVLG